MPVQTASTPAKTFDDDFNSFSTWNGQSGTWDTSRWYAPNGVAGYNGEQEWYVNPNYAPTASANPFSIVGGNLDITAKPATAAVLPYIGGQQYTSGLITTYHSFSQTYGYFEMRAELPGGQGLWPAFWLMPTDNSWPPELDAFEVLGNDPNLLYTTVHTAIPASGETYVSPGHYKTTAYTDVADTSKGFHIYGVDWKSDKITWYFDGAPVFQTATPADMDKPMYLLANLAIGGSWPGNPNASTAFPATMSVDYIRAYTARPTDLPMTWDAGKTVTPGSQTFAAPVILGGAVTLDTPANQVTTLTGGVANAAGAVGSLTKTGGGTLVLDGADTYTGGTELDSGALDIAWSGAAGTGPITFAEDSGATLTVEWAGQSTAGTTAAVTEFMSEIVGFDVSDTIDLAGIGAAAGAIVDAATGTLTLASADGTTLDILHLAGDLSRDVFTATDDGKGGTELRLLDASQHPDAVVVRVSGDSYLGAPDFTVTADATQVGGTFQIWASHAAGQYEDIVAALAGPSVVGQVAVTFINDAYGGSAAMDRNLYVRQVTAAGCTVDGAGQVGGTVEAPLYGNGSAACAIAPTTPATENTAGLVLNVSEDAYEGNAQFIVSVNGVQQGGIYTATASHALGQVQEVGVAGSFGPGPLDVGVTFLNDLYGGTPAADRNLYVSSIKDRTVTTGTNAAFWSNGTQSFAVTDGTAPRQAAPDLLTLHLSEDAYDGDAQFNVSVDGVQQGGIRTVTADHGAGASQEFDIAGSFRAGAHDVLVAFLNDAYGGAPWLDRNLYVDAITLNGQTMVENAGLYWTSSQTFGIPVPTASATGMIGGLNVGTIV